MSMSTLETELKKGCTGPEAINIWLMNQQKHNKACTVSFNSNISRAPVTWYRSTGQTISIDCSSNFEMDLKSNYPVVTCGLLKRVGKKFYYGHYYCIYIDPVLKQLIILNPNGHSIKQHNNLKLLYYTLSYWIEQHCGITLSYKYSTIINGPQYNYSLYDKGYCGPWACMVLYHIVKKSSPVKTFEAISSFNIKVLGRHINAIIKSIARYYSKYQRNSRVVLPPINGPKYKLQYTCRGLKLKPLPQLQ